MTPPSRRLTTRRRTFNPTPSLAQSARDHRVSPDGVPADADVVGVPVRRQGPVPRQLGLDRATLAASGFDGKVGQTLVVPAARRADASSPSASAMPTP